MGLGGFASFPLPINSAVRLGRMRALASSLHMTSLCSSCVSAVPGMDIYCQSTTSAACLSDG